MQVTFLKSLYNFAFGDYKTPKFTTDGLTIQSETAARVTQKGTTFASVLKSLSDFTLAGYTYKYNEVIAQCDYSGINDKYINEFGMFDYNGMVGDFQRSAAGMRIQRNEVDGMVKANMLDDSHEAFLLNMLISWFFAMLYRDIGGEDGKFEYAYTGYEDSHVRLEFNGVSERTTGIYELGYPVNTLPDEGPVERTMANYYDRPYVFKYPATSAAASTFYLCHLYGRNKRSSLNADIEIPAGPISEMFIEAVGGRVYAMNPDAVPWTDPSTIWMYIKDYVEVNRLHIAFACALEMLVTIAAQPMPSFQESVVWSETALVVNLAPFRPVRGRIPLALDGKPYMPDTNSHGPMSEDTANMKLFMLSGTILNYSMWYGIYALADNERRGYDNWRHACMGHFGEMQILRSKDMRAAMLSMVHGKDIFSYATDNGFITFDFNGMDQTAAWIVAHDKEERGLTSIPINQLCPLVSGALLLGVVGSDLRALEYLQSNGAVTTGEKKTYSKEDVAKLATLYRVFGHDVVVSHWLTAASYSMFANVKECVPYFGYVFEGFLDGDSLLVDSQPRLGGRHDVLMPMFTLQEKDVTSYVYEQPRLMVTAKGRIDMPMPQAIVVHDKRKEVTFRVQGQRVYKKVILRNQAEPVPQSFPVDGSTTAPRRPVPGPQTVAAQHAASHSGADVPAAQESATAIGALPVE